MWPAEASAQAIKEYRSTRSTNITRKSKVEVDRIARAQQIMKKRMSPPQPPMSDTTALPAKTQLSFLDEIAAIKRTSTPSPITVEKTKPQLSFLDEIAAIKRTSTPSPITVEKTIEREMDTTVGETMDTTMEEPAKPVSFLDEIAARGNVKLTSTTRTAAEDNQRKWADEWRKESSTFLALGNMDEDTTKWCDMNTDDKLATLDLLRTNNKSDSPLFDVMLNCTEEKMDENKWDDFNIELKKLLQPTIKAVDSETKEEIEMAITVEDLKLLYSLPDPKLLTEEANAKESLKKLTLFTQYEKKGFRLILFLLTTPTEIYDNVINNMLNMYSLRKLATIVNEAVRDLATMQNSIAEQFFDLAMQENQDAPQVSRPVLLSKFIKKATEGSPLYRSVAAIQEQLVQGGIKVGRRPGDETPYQIFQKAKKGKQLGLIVPLKHFIARMNTEFRELYKTTGKTPQELRRIDVWANNAANENDMGIMTKLLEEEVVSTQHNRDDAYRNIIQYCLQHIPVAMRAAYISCDIDPYKDFYMLKSINEDDVQFRTNEEIAPIAVYHLVLLESACLSGKQKRSAP